MITNLKKVLTKLSNKQKIAIVFSIVMIVAPLYLAYVTIPEWIERYESGAPIGVEIDIFTETPMGDLTVTQKSESGSEVLANGKVFLKNKYTFTPDTLPEGMNFYIALTEKHYDGVEFREFVDSVFGTSGDAVEIFEEMQFFIPIIGSMLSSAQGILTIFRDERKPGFWFYEYTYIRIIQIKKVIKSTNEKSVEFHTLTGC